MMPTLSTFRSRCDASAISLSSGLYHSTLIILLDSHLVDVVQEYLVRVCFTSLSRLIITILGPHIARAGA